MSSNTLMTSHILEFSSFPVVCQAVIFISNPHIGSRTSGLSCHSLLPPYSSSNFIFLKLITSQPCPNPQTFSLYLTLHPTLSWQQPLTICLHALFPLLQITMITRVSHVYVCVWERHIYVFPHVHWKVLFTFKRLPYKISSSPPYR